MNKIILISISLVIFYVIFLNYSAFSIYEKMRVEVNAAIYKRVKLEKWQVLKINSIPFINKPTVVNGLSNQILDLYGSSDLRSLFLAMNYSVPGWNFINNESNKLSANRAMLKGILAPHTSDQTIYYENSEDNEVVRLVHWYKKSIVEYRIENGLILMGIRTDNSGNGLSNP